METALLVAIFVSIFLAFLPALLLSGEGWKAAEERARGRRLAEARMNARLLRFNL